MPKSRRSNSAWPTKPVAVTFWDNPVTAHVPATSANLGPGYDSFGLALDVMDEVSAAVTSGGLAVQVEGEGEGEVSLDESHLVVSTMREAFAAMDAHPAGLSVHCINRIPHARGLGSSSAAIVAGLWLARALVVDGDERLTNDALLALASRIEGHPDNVAPCLLGGFTIAWQDSDGVAHAVSRPVATGIAAVAFIPATGLNTRTARQLLPASVPHADAAFNVARAALLVEALTMSDASAVRSGDASRAARDRAALLVEATDDRLHQAQRAVAMPESFSLVERLRAAGIPAFISGAGPTVLALTTHPAMSDVIRSIPAPDFRVLDVSMAERGVTIIDG